MNLLTGEFRNTLDDKGRISLPARLRLSLPGNVLIITQGIDDCLWLFNPDQWESLAGKLMESTSPFLARSRMIQRRIIAPAQETEIDKVGRIAIPSSLRDFAGLTKECVILAVDKYLELWDVERYKSYWSDHETEFQAASEELGSIIL